MSLEVVVRMNDYIRDDYIKYFFSGAHKRQGCFVATLRGHRAASEDETRPLCRRNKRLSSEC